jgi:hypothetical protein
MRGMIRQAVLALALAWSTAASANVITDWDAKAAAVAGAWDYGLTRAAERSPPRSN